MVKYISKAISKFVDSGPWAGTDDSKHDNPPPYSVQGRHSLDAVRQPLPHVPHHRPDVIAVMGPTGTGKTTFISKLAAREVEIGHNLSSCGSIKSHNELGHNVIMQVRENVKKFPVKSATDSSYWLIRQVSMILNEATRTSSPL